MIFPEAPRVIYQNNPLVGVLLQLRFPPILRIDTEMPVAFQERVRSQYPLFEQIPFINLVPTSIDSITVNMPISIGPRINTFFSADRSWTVSLASDFISISTTHYKRWEDFKAHFTDPLQAFIDVYSPHNFTRVGLRYQDLIRRSALGLNNDSWSKLLNPYIAGALSLPAIEKNISAINSKLDIILDKVSIVQINHGLVLQPEPKELCYLIDSDFSTATATEINDVTERIDAFNKHSGYLFKWCITEYLHNAMQPISI